MLKAAFLCSVIIITGATPGGLSAQQLEEKGEIRVFDYTFVFPEADSQPPAKQPTQAVLDEVAAWLSKNFDLPKVDTTPRVELASPVRIAAVRYNGLLQHQAAAVDAGDETVAVYDPTSQTIYLPEGWLGVSPAERSVLVHEVVHHIQNRAQIKYECPQAREKIAYAAQARWLSQHDLTLESEFQIDPFTLLVRINCMG
jgi:Domain of unknown function (DUF6647)